MFKEGGPRVCFIVCALSFSRWLHQCALSLKGILLNTSQVLESEFDTVVGQEITN